MSWLALGLPLVVLAWLYRKLMDDFEYKPLKPGKRNAPVQIKHGDGTWQRLK